MAIANQVYLNRGCEAKQAWNHAQKSKRKTHAESSAGDRVHGDDLWLKAGSFGMKLAEPERWRWLRWKPPASGNLTAHWKLNWLYQ